MRRNAAENVVRLFGMTGMQIQADIEQVARKYDVALRPKAQRSAEEDDATYYPQFEEQIRREADRMAEHYKVFYCLERSIRVLIKQRLVEEKGATWWDTDVPQAVRDEVKKNMDRERDAALTQRSDDPLDYSTFGQLQDIISANWQLFADTFSSQKAMGRVMASLNILRGPIAHSCPMAEDEIDRLRLTVKDWFRLMA